MTKSKCPTCGGMQGQAAAKWGEEFYHGTYAVRLRGFGLEGTPALAWTGQACNAMCYVLTFYSGHSINARELRRRLDNKWVGWGECFEAMGEGEL